MALENNCQAGLPTMKKECESANEPMKTMLTQQLDCAKVAQFLARRNARRNKTTAKPSGR